MPTIQPATRLALIATAFLVLAACKNDPDATGTGTDPATSAAPASAEAAAPAAQARDASADLQGDVIASTNEPFWQAQTSGPVMILRGLEGERQLAISTSDVAGATRTLRASDPNGMVELKVTMAECQDSMSGASFPYTAVLVIDGGAALDGCARPASMPAPGEGM
jgi:uncharacterized membrane protein